MVMTEAEWLACTDPQGILWWLRDAQKATERKLRLFAVAYCRHQWHLLVDVRSKKAVEVAERFADGLASESERKRAASDALAAASVAGEARKGAEEVSLPSLTAYAATAAWYTVFYEASPAASTTCDADAVDWYAENGVEMPHPKLLRELFGNPFRSIGIDSAWLAWNDGSVVKLAQDIYNERAFDRLPTLADALERAGCEDADILAHCRQQGPHVRGCWVVDLLLGK
jgi:hypothetical protein